MFKALWKVLESDIQSVLETEMREGSLIAIADGADVSGAVSTISALKSLITCMMFSS